MGLPGVGLPGVGSPELGLPPLPLPCSRHPHRNGDGDTRVSREQHGSGGDMTAHLLLFLSGDREGIKGR